MELWHQDVSSPRGVMHVARRVEAQGWDGLSVVDSQNLSGDCYVALAMAASSISVVTNSLRLYRTDFSRLKHLG